MAFFKRKEKAPAEPARLDWKLMERGAVALYHKTSILSADVGWFRQERYVIRELEAAGWSTPQAFHDDAKRVLGLSRSTTRRISWRGSTALASCPCRTKAAS